MYSARTPLADSSRLLDVELDVGDANIDDSVFKPLQHLVNQARNAKVVTKCADPLLRFKLAR